MLGYECPNDIWTPIYVRDTWAERNTQLSLKSVLQNWNNITEVMCSDIVTSILTHFTRNLNSNQTSGGVIFWTINEGKDRPVEKYKRN